MGRLAPARPCQRCGMTFKPIKGNHRNLCSTLCRFMEKVDPLENGCWAWTAFLDDCGYGVFRVMPQKTVKAHRWAYENLGNGVLVGGQNIDHLCRNRACVRPSHLEQVTHAENMRRSIGYSTLTHCVKAGHEFTEENTGWQTGGSKRYCRQCKRDREAPAARRYRARRREQTNA